MKYLRELQWLGRSALLLGASVVVLQGCPTRGNMNPEGGMMEDTTTPPGEVGTDSGPMEEGAPGDTQVPPPPPPEDVPPGMDTGTPPADTGVPPADGPRPDGPPPVDTGGPPPEDVPVLTDTGPRPGPSCRPFTATPRTDPCPGRPDCGLPSHGRVDVTGVRTALREFQVRVVLPAGVRGALGAACDRLVFRTMDNTWAPHFVTDCAGGVVWVRVPSLGVGMTTLQMHYGGGAAVAAAQSYDDTFDRVPVQAAGMLGAYAFDEGMGTRTCPTVGTTAFDAFLLEFPYSNPPNPMLNVRGAAPNLWSTEGPRSALAPTNPAARFRRGQFSLNFPRSVVTMGGPLAEHCNQDAGTCPDRLVNWQSASPAPFDTARMQLTVAAWVRPESPSNAFNDNFQTVVCYGMPDATRRAAHWRMTETSPDIINNAIFNPWAIFFRGDAVDDSLYQGNTCVSPCLDVIHYAHITTTVPLAGAAFVNNWHFIAFTFDATTRPHTTRTSYYEGRQYNYPADLELFPQDRLYCPMPLSFGACNPAEGMPRTCGTTCQPLCPGGRGPCIYPPEAPIEYPPSPVVIGADFNDGIPGLGIEGQVDDMFIMGRSIPPAEMAAYRENRAYSADPIMTTVTP